MKQLKFPGWRMILNEWINVNDWINELMLTTYRMLRNEWMLTIERMLMNECILMNAHEWLSMDVNHCKDVNDEMNIDECLLMNIYRWMPMNVNQWMSITERMYQYRWINKLQMNRYTDRQTYK